MTFDFRCPVCGMAMVHSRLRGYHCHFESHNLLSHVMDVDAALNHHVLTDDEIEAGMDDYVNHEQSIELSDSFRERALKAMREAQKRRAVKFN